MTIKVDDANDQRPKFIHRVFRTNISEAADPGSTILTLEARDNDIGINAKLRFSIERGNNDRQFRIEEETGRLLVAKSLDFEITRDYELEVKVGKNIPLTYPHLLDISVSLCPRLFGLPVIEKD